MRVPAQLAAVAERLRCPICLQPLAPTQRSLICPNGHTHDVARQGYVTLRAPTGRPADGDDAGMIAARAAVQDAGHFEKLTAALVAAARAAGGSESSLILDVGAGTGHHLAGLLGAMPHARGIALDASRDAARRAARRHHRIAAVRGDVWQQIPLGDATVDLALSVFAPRNGAELVRVVRPDGAVLVATPTSAHLHELAALHTVRVDPSKLERLRRRLTPAWCPTSVRRITWTLELTRHDAEALVRMGPAAGHLKPDLERRLASLREPVLATAAIELRTFRRASARSGWFGA
ncbi:MAG TPA: methyltransferase domain-containing protein [Solirubrobacteraceae bacterium]|nr:methyltransferase domain-containing protein [Solirubrobacteraceae bacterium]